MSEEEKVSQQDIFKEERKNYSDKDIQLELLFTQRQLLKKNEKILKVLKKNEKILKNTKTLIWYLVVVPYILAGLWLLYYLSNLVE